MRAKDFNGMACSVAVVMGAIGDRWGLLVMRDLLLGLRRYDDLQRSSGITNATLSDRLKTLEANGLIERRLYQTRPDRYEYLPTPRGYDLVLLMQAMVQIGDRWNPLELAGPPLEFIDSKTGRAMSLAQVDKDTGAIVEAPSVSAAGGPGADEIMMWRLTQGSRP